MINDLSIKRFVVGRLQANCYIVSAKDSHECVMIDPGDLASEVEDYLIDNDFRLKYILITHGHFDHIGGVDYFRNRFGAKVCVSADDAAMLTNPAMNLSEFSFEKITSKDADILLRDDDTLSFGEGIVISTIYTPGHTPGGVCYKIDDVCFTGDTLFKESIGRTDFPGGDFNEILNSIKSRLFTLPDRTLVFPGHGDMTTIKDEKLRNPFVRFS
ncbi:MAG: MBL fold metallo-hydrolase [Thermoanaerobacterium sp.]|nr:MBL fold metallo-hydrolase [Thermoanaerobacterium sp.]